MTYFDISPTLEASIAVWPGDQKFERSIGLSIAEGSNIDLSSIRTSVHVGAHADGPSHYHGDGKAIALVNLEAYWGKCIVVKLAILRNQLILPEHCREAVESGVKRVLFCTNTYPDPRVFNRDFAAFSPEALDFLGSRGVLLVGIDTPSVDLFDSKDLPAHQMLYNHGIANLEGLVLSHVPPGIYELSALPLKIADSDGSPVRAALKSLI